MDLGGALNAETHVSQSAEKTIYTLSQLGESLKRTLERVTEGRALWFKAEISKLTTGPTGHVYLDLVEEKDGRRLAVMRAPCGGSSRRRQGQTWRQRRPILQAGSEIVFSGRVNYHAVFGVSLVIEDIDLDAMVGEAERRKQATLATLKKEGALATNGLLPCPGWCNALRWWAPRHLGLSRLRCAPPSERMGSGLRRRGVPTSVQGKHAPAEIVAALEAAAASVPDVVVLVRGGGSALDLDAFNDLELCRAISRCPIPVLTGIGHESDLSVADLVAHTQFKTPTAVADGLVDKMVQEQSLLLEWTGQMSRHTHQRLAWERERLAHLTQTMRLQPDQMLKPRPSNLATCANARCRWRSKPGAPNPTHRPTPPNRRRLEARQHLGPWVLHRASPRQGREGRRVAVQGRRGRTSISPRPRHGCGHVRNFESRWLNTTTST